MKRKRIIYFNDARHYYLFVFEPPMTLADAWVPIDEVAGTSVDTFCYGVERGDGLFYPSRVGMRFGADMATFEQAAYWRVWHNMQSLIDRGLDPLTVLVDRAHDKGMDFIASLRMTGHGGMDPEHRLENGGGGLAHQEVRDHQFAVVEELVTEYATDGVELDFALPGGGPRVLRPGDVESHTPVLTEYVAMISEMVRSRKGGPGQVGVRVLPTEETNVEQGLDVRAWLREGLVDFVVPMYYAYFILDPNMPVDWLIDAAADADISVYGALQPYVHDEQTGASGRAWATPDQMRAAVANLYAKGADGMYTWFMRWPLGDAERRILTELGDPDLVAVGDKHYVLARTALNASESHYKCHLPLEIPSTDKGSRHGIPFYLADDIAGAAGNRIRQIRLRVKIDDLVTADRLRFFLNGQSLEGEHCLRSSSSEVAPYMGQWLEFHLREVLPRQGDNLLEVSLEIRADGLVSPLKVAEVEVLIEYGPYPSSPRFRGGG